MILKPGQRWRWKYFDNNICKSDLIIEVCKEVESFIHWRTKIVHINIGLPPDAIGNIVYINHTAMKNSSLFTYEYLQNQDKINE